MRDANDLKGKTFPDKGPKPIWLHRMVALSASFSLLGQIMLRWARMAGPPVAAHQGGPSRCGNFLAPRARSKNWQWPPWALSRPSLRWPRVTGSGCVAVRCEGEVLGTIEREAAFAEEEV